MKRRELEAHLRAHGCVLNHHGAKHDVWLNPKTVALTTIPRHGEIKWGTLRSICKVLGIPPPRGR